MKRLARRASLQSITEGHILDCRTLFSWCVENIKSVFFAFVSNDDVSEMQLMLEPRFAAAPSVPSIMSLHCIVPLSLNALWVKRYSFAPKGKRVQFEAERPTSIDDYFEFCIIWHEDKWWLAMAKTSATAVQVNRVILNKLHPHGSRRSYHYPEVEDECSVPFEKILLHVMPTPKNDGTFILSRKTKQKISEELPKPSM